MSETADLRAAVEGHDGIFVLRAGRNCRDWNGIHYQVGLSDKNVGAKALSMNVATIPPGGVAYAHIHVGFEVMVYILAGRVPARVWRGERSLGVRVAKGTRTFQIGHVNSALVVDLALRVRRGWRGGRTGTDPADFACGTEHPAPSLLRVACGHGRLRGVTDLADAR